jgi:hypothetical protein
MEESLKDHEFLSFVPRIKVNQQWSIGRDGLVQIIVPRDRLLDRAVRLFRKTPKTIMIHLDPQGSFVWNAIDGKRCILDIGMMLEAEFGEKAKPVYERLTTYLRILKNNRFISLDNRF